MGLVWITRFVRRANHFWKWFKMDAFKPVLVKKLPRPTPINNRLSLLLKEWTFNRIHVVRERNMLPFDLTFWFWPKWRKKTKLTCCHVTVFGTHLLSYIYTALLIQTDWVFVVYYIQNILFCFDIKRRGGFKTKVHHEKIIICLWRVAEYCLIGDIYVK